MQEAIEITISDLDKPTGVKVFDKHDHRVLRLTTTIAKIINPVGLEVTLLRIPYPPYYIPSQEFFDSHQGEFECVAIYNGEEPKDPSIIIKELPESKFLVRVREGLHIPENLQELVQKMAEEEIEYFSSYPNGE